MGYDIRPISEINTFDYSLCSGYSTKDTVRKSIDLQFFVVEGDTFNTYTHAQILVEMAKPNWTDNTI
jgi:hypothetical protein